LQRSISSTTVFGIILGAITMRYLKPKKSQKHLKEMKDETQIREEAKKYLLEPVKFVEEYIIVGSRGSRKTTL
jgi:type IV secretory pathway ATPase VirB11/archaellum biosynthesis ATPase